MPVERLEINETDADNPIIYFNLKRDEYPDDLNLDNDGPMDEQRLSVLREALGPNCMALMGDSGHKNIKVEFSKDRSPKSPGGAESSLGKKFSEIYKNNQKFLEILIPLFNSTGPGKNKEELKKMYDNCIKIKELADPNGPQDEMRFSECVNVIKSLNANCQPFLKEDLILYYGYFISQNDEN